MHLNNLFENHLQQKNQKNSLNSIHYTTKTDACQVIYQKLHERHFSFLMLVLFIITLGVKT